VLVLNFLEWKGYAKEDARGRDEIPCVICFWTLVVCECDLNFE